MHNGRLDNVVSTQTMACIHSRTLALVALSTLNTFRRTWLSAICRLVVGRSVSQLTALLILHGVMRTYPQLRQENLLRRGSVQSRARCPTASQLKHFTSTRSKVEARSSLQPLAVCPISVICMSVSKLMRNKNHHLRLQLLHLGTWRS